MLWSPEELPSISYDLGKMLSYAWKPKMKTKNQPVNQDVPKLL